MKIIYKQSAPSDQNNLLQNPAFLQELGITDCHFKQVRPTVDSHSITTKPHHHTTCEIHLVVTGAQYYRVDGSKYDVTAGSFLLIPPGVVHQHLTSEPETRKYSVTFSIAEPAPTHLAAHLGSQVLLLRAPEAVWALIEDIEAEAQRYREYSPTVIECSIFRFFLCIARASGFREEPLPRPEEEDPRLSMARRYVQDNIDRPIICPELANYCHISEKQLSRLFLRFTGKTTAAYIRGQKVHRIEQLLAESGRSLKQISEQMGFASEYHFNSFFTKYAGMPPGAYRKMINHPDFSTPHEAQ